MQADHSNKIFSILKNTSDCLILKNQAQKFIRKTFIIKQQTLKLLVERQKLTHPNLISLHHIQFSHFLPNNKLVLDIVFQHYCRSLDQCFVRQQCQWDDGQIINTFEPIVSLIDYLHAQKISLTDFSLENIVSTQEQSIKFIDSFLLNRDVFNLQITPNTNNFTNSKIYNKIADQVFSINHPTLSCQNWKTKLKIIKQSNSQQMYNFIVSILAKSADKGLDLTKNKKIKKSAKVFKLQNARETIKKQLFQQKKDKESLSSCELGFCAKHQGKQNKLQQ